MKKLDKDSKSYLNYQADEFILFANELGGPSAVKRAVRRINKAVKEGNYKQVEKRYWRSRNVKI